MRITSSKHKVRYQKRVEGKYVQKLWLRKTYIDKVPGVGRYLSRPHPKVGKERRVGLCYYTNSR